MTENINMTDFKSRFNTWYFNEFHTTELFSAMYDTVEDSPWHREANVGVHTDMVVGQYVGMSPPKDWSREDLCGALVCAFHDVGKPAAEETRHSEERGEYRRYTGHELISTRLWEDYAVKNWAHLVETFEMRVEEIYLVGWAIEHHLPYGVKKREKVDALLRTIDATITGKVFRRVLRADTLGKMCDDHETKIENNNKWIHDFFGRSLYDCKFPADDAPTLYMLIGASGSGKSTFTKTLENDPGIFSWDQLRLDWYVEDKTLPIEEQYRIAFEKSTEDKEFNAKANAKFFEYIKDGQDVAIDNTNGSNKRRKFFVTEARRRGYNCVAVLFPIDLDTLLARQESRTDKTVPEVAVRRQYMQLQYPFFEDFDEIRALTANL